MTIAEMPLETVLQYAKQLKPQEQAQLIGQLAEGLVTQPIQDASTDRMAILRSIREELRQSGYTPRSAEEVNTYIEAERNSWDE